MVSFFEKIKRNLSYTVLFMAVFLSHGLSAGEWIKPISYKTLKLETEKVYVHTYEEGLVLVTSYSGPLKGSQIMLIDRACVAEKSKPDNQINYEDLLYDLYLYDNCYILHGGAYQEAYIY